MDHWQPKLLTQIIPKILPQKSSKDSDDDIGIVDDINSSSFVTYNNSSLQLPRFIYTRDEVTGEVSTHLAIGENSDFVTDKNYTSRQQWLLNQRQGDQYDRIREWIPRVELADLESNNESSINLVNTSMVWHGINIERDVTPISNYDRYIQYSMDELEIE